jgi:Spy/CpxP family protein refolding chaperone
VLGSRIGEQKHCGTVDQLKVTQEQSQDVTEKVQRSQKILRASEAPSRRTLDQAVLAA